MINEKMIQGSGAEIEKKQILSRSVVSQKQRSPWKLSDSFQFYLLVLLSEFAVLLPQDTNLVSQLIEEAAMLQFQLLNLFIFLAVEVGQLNLQFFDMESLSLFCLAFLNDQSFQLFFFLAFRSIQYMSQFLNLQVFLLQLRPLDQLLIFATQLHNIFFQSSYILFVFGIFQSRNRNLLGEMSILFYKLAILNFQLLTSILFDDALQLLQTVPSFIQATLISRCNFLIFQQFLRSHLPLFHQICILALKFLNYFHSLVKLFLANCQYPFQRFFLFSLIAAFLLQLQNQQIFLHLLLLIFFRCICLALSGMDGGGRSSFDSLHLTISFNECGAHRLWHFLLIGWHFNIQSTEIETFE